MQILMSVLLIKDSGHVWSTAITHQDPTDAPACMATS